MAKAPPQIPLGERTVLPLVGFKGPLYSREGGKGERRREWKGRKGVGRKGREGKGSWNRAADWLRPAQP